jgi:Ca-activated chloride channel family protein
VNVPFVDALGFDSPARLWLLLVVPALAAAYVVARRRRRRHALVLPGIARLAPALPRLGWRVHLPAALLLLSLGLATAAFAEPTGQVKVPRERATVIVALDVSLSMAAEDVDPDRITRAKQSAQAFVDRLPARFQVGLVSFSGVANLVVPPTQQHDQVVAAIDSLQLGDGTAIGDAVTAAVDAVRAMPGASSTSAPPARIVLLSDGANTVGSPVSAGVDDARAAGIPVSTIAYGTPDGVVQTPAGPVQVPVDGPALAALARETGGRSYSAQSGEELDGVYRDIGSQVGFITQRRPVAAGFAGAALLGTLAAATAGVAYAPRRV